MEGWLSVLLRSSTIYGAPIPAETAIIPKTPEPEISAIAPYVVVEGSPDFEIAVNGVGFVGNSVVRVDDIPVPTTFVDIRTVRAKVPAAAAARALPTRFNRPGPG